MDRVKLARWKLEAVLAALFAIATVVTAIFPEWIELFGLEPDGGDGSAEWAIVVVLGIATALTALWSRRDYLRVQRPLSAGGES